MEGESLLRVLSWCWLSGFVLTALGADNVRYVVIHQSALLDIPGPLHSSVEEVEWKSHNVLMGKIKVATGKETIGNCNCKMETNGSLLLHNLSSFEERTYSYSLYNNMGNLYSTGHVTVKVLELVDSPVISHNCFSKTAKVQCRVNSRNVSQFNMTCNGSCSVEAKEPNLLKMSLNQIDKPVSVMCEATNPLNSNKTTTKIDCTKPSSFWSIYMILAVAGGGVAFIIFLILLTYCVKNRCCRRDRRGDVKVSYATCHNTQQRYLPQPPLPQNTQTLTQPGVIPEEHSPGKRNQTTQRKTPPVPPTQDNRASPSKHNVQREPGDRGPQKNKKSQRPSLPSNHPSDQPPHPQPRNQSKPQRQPRRKQ